MVNHKKKQEDKELNDLFTSLLTLRQQETSQIQPPPPSTYFTVFDLINEEQI